MKKESVCFVSILTKGEDRCEINFEYLEEGMRFVLDWVKQATADGFLVLGYPAMSFYGTVDYDVLISLNVKVEKYGTKVYDHISFALSKEVKTC